jgi:hypothetical protein
MTPWNDRSVESLKGDDSVPPPSQEGPRVMRDRGNPKRISSELKGRLWRPLSFVLPTHLLTA